MKQYHANVERGDRFWLIYVPELDRWTQARKLGEVELMARDLIAIMEEVEPDSFELAITRKLPESVREHLDRAEELRREAAERNSEAAREARSAVKELVQAGVSQREAGELLGMSFQRVHQLVNS